jgi:hypothetical protein
MEMAIEDVLEALLKKAGMGHLPQKKADMLKKL